MTDPYAGFGTKTTPQSQPVFGRPEQVQNNAGGFVFQIDPFAQLRRFLTMGTAGGTYYAGEQELTRENGEIIVSFTTDVNKHKNLVDEIVAISVGGRAPKQQPGLFALAIACQMGTTEGKQYARSKINEVARTGSTLFTFVKYLNQFGGWSRGLRKAVGNWYVEKDADQLAYQLVKYRQRDGYTHRDVLRLSHPKIEEPRKRAAIQWALNKPADAEHVPDMLYAFDYAQKGPEDIPKILETQRLPWEALPDVAMNDSKVWDKLLDNGMPINALVRQLPRLTNIGLVAQMGGRTDEVVAQLLNPEAVKKSRIHPIQVLTALKTYQSGRGMRTEWKPATRIVDALDEMFYLSFGNVESTGKRTMLAIDASASMTWPENTPPRQPLTCREISAALAMVTVRTESNYITTAFSNSRVKYGRSYAGLEDLGLSGRQRLDDVVRTISAVYPGGTDCSLPITYALTEGLLIDTFVIYTDNDTWSGNIHPFQALQQYRKTTGIDARLVVAAMTPSKFSIADPRDPGMLDISGFDSAMPNLISDFSMGRV